MSDLAPRRNHDRFEIPVAGHRERRWPHSPEGTCSTRFPEGTRHWTSRSITAVACSLGIEIVQPQDANGTLRIPERQSRLTRQTFDLPGTEIQTASCHSRHFFSNIAL